MKYCRTCGEPPGDQNQLSEDLQEYSDIFYNLTSIRLTPEEDPNGQRICKNCHSKLLEYNDFRSTCIQVHHRLTNIKKELQPEKTQNEELAEQHPFAEILKTELIENNAEVDKCDEPAEVNESVDSDHETYICEMVSASSSTSEEKSDSEDEKPRTRTKNSKHQPKSKITVYSCNLCDKKFHTEIRYQGHLRVHQGLKPALCTYCGKDFMEYRNLKLHIAQKHSSEKVKYPCDFAGCGLAFTTKRGMVVHKRRHDPNYVLQKTKQRCVCDQCGKSFFDSATLKVHSYTHTGNMPFECKICNKRMPTAQKLKEHTMRHEGIKNHVCPHCGLKKTTRYELKVHMNTHTGEKQYPCRFCAQSFNSVGNMSRHVKIVHCGVKAFSCTYCDRSFGKAETLKHHVMTHTGEKPHECSVCGKRFIQSVALQTHMKTHWKHQQ
ncbi:gastrula zinc finger protein XlCGF26.1-like [Toxorhynchites rutilus septentrionalis]|uniref:gastrula zinc finger protein XlCGF26.1-like n=1 Tax=Toxorhynchites rutilus septentrionalis TaxID=329112 RepID=UPI002479ABF2|nr:gastrula zinc finger protein XlCGF26.1-like [Toxorhynchites rutilus septentrionalis]